ncbi:potassium channel family protein [Anaerofustis stercorihominis]|uniref:potassium channel family protein n=1 Tax=Anaerofustis stercorihominis TaxID=214853 RepID=UPI00267351AB|nr:potassium channel family protein [Anaerofustis stercorihominis]
MSGLWYFYSVISTVGFGDIVAVTLIGKILSVLLTMYSIIVIAIITGVVVNFYTEINKFQRKETLAVFMDKLERLPELLVEEQEEISGKIKDLR